MGEGKGRGEKGNLGCQRKVAGIDLWHGQNEEPLKWESRCEEWEYRKRGRMNENVEIWVMKKYMDVGEKKNRGKTMESV